MKYNWRQDYTSIPELATACKALADEGWEIIACLGCPVGRVDPAQINSRLAIPGQVPVQQTLGACIVSRMFQPDIPETKDAVQ